MIQIESKTIFAKKKMSKSQKKATAHWLKVYYNKGYARGFDEGMASKLDPSETLKYEQYKSLENAYNLLKSENNKLKRQNKEINKRLQKRNDDAWKLKDYDRLREQCVKMRKEKLRYEREMQQRNGRR